jgi:hypothetical protein
VFLAPFGAQAAPVAQQIILLEEPAQRGFVGIILMLVVILTALTESRATRGGG